MTIKDLLNLCAQRDDELNLIYNSVPSEELSSDWEVSDTLQSWRQEIDAIRITLSHLQDTAQILPECLRDSPLEYVADNNFEVHE